MDIGKHKNVPDKKFNQSELEIGTKIELEHTDDPIIAKEIAKDHLAEIPDYYSRLIKMEKEAGIDIENELTEQILRNIIHEQIVNILR